MADPERHHEGRAAVQGGRAGRGRRVQPAAPLTLLEVLKRSTRWLEGRGIESPRLDAELLMAHALGVARLDLYLQFDRPLSDAELDRIRELVRRRGDHVPVAYLRGAWEFHSLSFAVDPRVLVPRPETELLVDCALEHLAGSEAPVFADVGTGSGCVAISVLHELAGATGHATDVSPGALEVARANAERHGVSDRLVLHAGHLLDPVREAVGPGGLHAVLSNPPYVVRGDESVEPGVREHEPDAALYVPGGDPLAVFREIAAAARGLLASGGLLAMEVGAGSAPEGAAVLTDLGYEDVVVRDDLAGIGRVVLGKAP